MSVAHTSHIRIEKHQGPHRTAHVEGFSDAIDFGIHGGIKHFYQEKYGRETQGTALHTSQRNQETMNEKF